MSRSFNGTSDLINFGAQPTLQPQTITGVAWVKAVALTNAYSAILSCVGATNPTYQLFIKSSGKLAVYVGLTTSGNVDYDGTGTNTLVIGKWYHLAFSTGAGSLTGYVNGTVDHTQASAGTIVQQATIPTELSNDSKTSGRHLNGFIADAAIYDAVLTQPEIAALAAGARPPYVRPGSLAGYWPLDGLASPEPDLSGNKFNGTLTGTTLGPGAPISLLTPRWPQSLIISAAPTFTWFPMGADSNDFINHKADVIGY